MMRTLLCALMLSGVVHAQTPAPAVVKGADDWLFLSSEIRFLESAPFWDTGVANKDPLPAILDFQKQLTDAGIRLIVVPVPPKALLHGSALETPPEGRTLVSWYDVLRAKGVDVLDLSSTFSALPKETPAYCRTDSHWNGTGIRIAAEQLAARVKDVVPQGAATYRATARDASITGDLTKLPGGEGVGAETLSVEVVETTDGQPVAPTPQSPILLLGDSHTLVFHAGGDMHASGAGLADHLALKLGQPVDVLGVRGSGATASRISLMRRVRADPTYLSGKKVVIWCFAAREFTEADGWRLVPLAKP